MNDNRTIRIMVFETGRATYTTMLEDSLQHLRNGSLLQCVRETDRSAGEPTVRAGYPSRNFFPLWRYPGRTGRFFDR